MSFYKNKKKKKKNALKINNIHFTSITRDAHKPYTDTLLKAEMLAFCDLKVENVC